MAFDFPLALALAAADPQTTPPAPAIPIAVVEGPGEAAQAEQSAETAAADTGPAAEPEVIVVTREHGPPPGDPLEGVNVQSYQVVQAIDRVVIAPVSEAYEHVPNPVRSGLHNFLSNLTEPVVALNFLLQLKPGRAAETVGRFAINSTVGVAGLVDVAKRKPFHLPYRKNGLANTLGYYGVGPGPYLYLPLMGATTVRDLAGRIVDLSLVPTLVGKPLTDPEVAVARGSLSSLDDRLRDAPVLRALRESPDPYTATKERYLRLRQAEIDALRGIEPAPDAAEPDPAAP